MMRRRRRRSTGEASTFLTLTSLVDLFTNLVLFLLFNFSGDAPIPASDRLKLPESVSQQDARTSVTVMITSSDIVLEGKKVVEIANVVAGDDLLIPQLKEGLDYEAKKGKYFASVAEGKTFEGRVTILGDKNIPFRLLEKVMYTCSQAEFGQIDLGVIRKET
jgi:biopolymer transport protein ExbD